MAISDTKTIRQTDRHTDRHADCNNVLVHDCCVEPLSVLQAVCYDCLQVSSAEGGHDIGRVYKQWSGFVKEIATDADNFGVSCEFARSYAVAFEPFS